MLALGNNPASLFLRCRLVQIFELCSEGKVGTPERTEDFLLKCIFLDQNRQHFLQTCQVGKRAVLHQIKQVFYFFLSRCLIKVNLMVSFNDLLSNSLIFAEDKCQHFSQAFACKRQPIFIQQLVALYYFDCVLDRLGTEHLLEQAA